MKKVKKKIYSHKFTCFNLNIPQFNKNDQIRNNFFPSSRFTLFGGIHK